MGELRTRDAALLHIQAVKSKTTEQDMRKEVGINEVDNPLLCIDMLTYISKDMHLE